MPPGDFWLLIALPVLLIFSGIFSGAETALFSLSPAERSSVVRSPGGKAVARLLAHPDRLLVTVLMLNMTVNVVYLVITSVLTMRVEGAALKVAASAGPLIALVLFGEILAKLLASAHRTKFALAIAPVILLAQRLFGPLLIGTVRFVVAPLVRLFMPSSASAQRRLAASDLGELLDQAAQRGVIDQEERRMLNEVLGLGERRVRDVMTPRVDIAWLEEGFPADDLVQLVRRSSHTRFPLHRGPLDEEHVLGFLDAKGYLADRAAGLAPRAELHLTRPTFVPEQSRLDQLLEHFRTTGTHMALCVDEFGGISGLVEIEDVVEELLPAADSDATLELDQVHMIGLGQWVAPGRLPLHEWSRLFGVEPPPEADKVSTLAGLVFHELGRIPVVGDELRVGSVGLRVESMSGRTVRTVRVSIDPQGDAR